MILIIPDWELECLAGQFILTQKEKGLECGGSATDVGGGLGEVDAEGVDGLQILLFRVRGQFDSRTDPPGSFDGVFGAAFVGKVILAVFVKDDEGDSSLAGGDFGFNVEIVAGIGNVLPAFNPVGAELVLAD